MRLISPFSVALIMVLLLFGCASEPINTSSKAEQVANQESFDINEDGINDYAAYYFAPLKLNDVKTSLKRTVLVSLESDVTLDSSKKLTDADLLVIDAAFENFLKTSVEVDNACSSKLGLSGVACPDPKTCVRVCSTASLKCKNMAQSYESALGSSIFSFQKDTVTINELASQIRNRIPKLKEFDSDEKQDFLNRLNDVIEKVASIKTNPIFSKSELALCDLSEYDLDELVKISGKIAKSSTQPKLYRYTVLISADTSDLSKEENFRYSELIFREELSSSFNLKESDVSLPGDATASQNNSKLTIQWQPVKASTGKTVLMYSFTSSLEPDVTISNFRSPQTQLKNPSIDFLKPTLFVYQLLFNLTNNFYLSLAFAFSLTMIVILGFVLFITVVINLLQVLGATNKYAALIKKSFGRTRVTWKTDAVVGVLALIIGIASMNFLAPQITSFVDIFSALDIIINDYRVVIPLAGLFFGPLFLYMAIENRIKIATIESVYGRKIKEEKDLFVANVSQIKMRLQELKALLDALTKENFDVGAEYDVLDSISVERIDTLSKKMDSYSRRVIEDELAKIEEIIQKVQEKKRVALESWPQWSATIAKILEESEELHASNLISIPASLRTWAMQLYVKEHAEEGLSMDGDGIKRKVVTPEKVANSLVSRGLLKGCVIIKDSKIVLSSVPAGSTALIGALTAKLLSYLKFLPKHLAQHDFNSLVTVGETYVLVLLKHRTVHALLFIQKEKFKEAMDEWKNKMQKF